MKLMIGNGWGEFLTWFEVLSLIFQVILFFSLQEFNHCLLCTFMLAFHHAPAVISIWIPPWFVLVSLETTKVDLNIKLKQHKRNKL